MDLKDRETPVTARHRADRLGLWGYILALGVGWTLVVALSLGWNLYQEKEEALALATQVARSHFDKDILYRSWNARHGGVYAPVSPHNPPNPYLSHLAERDLTTPAGKTLTLINPSYMLRQVYELAKTRHDLKARVTSLRPLNPKNAPDPWEAEALRHLEKGGQEVSAIATEGGRPYVRLLRPIYAEQGCLKCHAQQDYRVGKVAGGFAISVPLEPFLAAKRSQWWALVLGHGVLWLLVLVGIVWHGWQLKQKVRARRRAEEALEESTANYRELVENAGAIIMRLNPQGQVTFLNEYAQHFFGYAEFEVVGRPVVGAIVPETDSAGNPQTARVQEMCERPENYPHHEQETMKRHGERAWVGWTTKAMRDEAGELQEILWVGHDLTEHRRTEEAVAKANAELQSLVYEYGERNRQISLLNRMAELLQACLTPREAYPIIARYSHELFAGCAGSLFVPQANEGLLIAAAVWGETVAGEKEFALGDCWALRTGRPYVGGELEAAIECPHLSTHPVDRYLCVPMMAQGETLGLLHLQLDNEMAGEAGDFGDDSRELPQQLAVMVADHVALALGNLNLRETLKQQAIRDPLTGLFNRRYLTETLEREFHRLKRKAGSLGIIMLDLDHFKKVNDTYGHEGGDALLKVLGGFLKHAVRAGDIACRYGGEEFVLILSEAPLEVTLERAQAINQGVKKLKVHHQGRVLEDVTVSVGVAVYPDHGVSGNDLLQAADAALYRAKQEGRDRVVCA